MDLERFMETMGTDGQKIPTVEEREASQPMQKIMPRWLNNVLVMTCTVMTTVLMIIILVPTTTTKVKVATAGRAFGMWYDNTNTFQFKLLAGVCAADMSFIVTTDIHEFHFTLDSAKASHIALEHIDYEHTSSAFLLEHAFNHNGQKPQVVDLPLPRVADISRYHNPTRPSYLRGGALVRYRRSYSPNEIRSVQAMGLEQSPIYLSKGINSRNRARSVSQPRSGGGRNSIRSRERSREKSTSPYCTRTQRVPPSRRDSRSISNDRGRSRSPSVPRICSDSIWKRRRRAMLVEHSKFIWDTVSYISNLKAFFDFAIGCGIPNHIVRKAIEDNDPSDDDISLEDSVVQALTIWWISSNRPAIWKSEKIKQGFVGLHMPGIYACLGKRHPTLDPTPPEPTPQNDPQPGTSGQMSPRPRKYLSLESLAIKLISTEYDFLRELSYLIQTPENAYGLVCMTNLPDETFVYIRQEHTHFGLSVKEIQSRIAFHVLAIWYLQAKGKYHSYA